MTIDKSGPIPIYVQVADELREQIGAGDYTAMGRLPSETDLMRHYGIAQLTARRAVRVLVGEGLVRVVPGRGTYLIDQQAAGE
jgi:GntR family transcriptional regulator